MICSRAILNLLLLGFITPYGSAMCQVTLDDCHMQLHTWIESSSTDTSDIDPVCLVDPTFLESIEDRAIELYGVNDENHIYLDSLIVDYTVDREVKINATCRLLVSYQRLNNRFKTDHYIKPLTDYLDSDHSDPTTLLNVYIILSKYYLIQGSHTKSWIMANDGYSLADQFGDSRRAIFLQLFKLQTYQFYKLETPFLDLSMKVLESAYNQRDTALVVYAYQYLTSAYLNLDNIAMAKSTLHDYNVKLPEHHKDHSFMLYLDGRIAIEECRFFSADSIFHNGITLSREKNEPHHIGLNYLGLAMLNLQLNRFDRSRTFLDSCMAYVFTAEVQEDLFQFKKELFYKVGDDKSLTDTYLAYENYNRQSLERGQKGDLMEALFESFYLDKMEHQEQILTQQHKNKQMLYALFVLIALFLVIIFHDKKKLTETELADIKERKKISDALNVELDLLNNVLLHDLNSPLLSLQHLLTKALINVDCTTDYIHSSLGIVDAMFSVTRSVYDFKFIDSSSTDVSLHQLISDLCVRQASLMNVRHHREFRYDVSLDQQYGYNDSFYILTILRNIMDNIIKHHNCKLIHLTARDRADQVSFHITFDGSSLDQRVIDMYSDSTVGQCNSSRKGMYLIHFFLKKLHGKINVVHRNDYNLLSFTAPVG